MAIIRVLHCVNNMHRAGLETMLMNYYRNIDRTKIQFDFLTHRPERSDYDDEIESLGGKIYYAPRLYPQNYPAYFKWMKQFFKEHPEYQIIHSHIDTMSYLPLLAAKKAGIPIRIAHSHSTGIDKDFKYILKQIFRHRITSVANTFMACGEIAGRFLFDNENFKIIPNAVKAEQLYFDELVRKEKRKELGIETQWVLGHVGRICYPKNHEFLIEIFSEIVKMDSSAILLIIGVGDKEEEIKQYASELKLNNHIRFLGNRDDVSELYQAMDVFVLPSLFEGVPLVGIEAQFADLPCLFSNRVPTEVKFNKKTQFLPLESGAKFWANKILECKELGRNSNREEMNNSCFNITTAYEVLEQQYFMLHKSVEMIKEQ